MISLSTALQEPVMVEIDGKPLKFAYLTLGDYKAIGDWIEVALASLRKYQPTISRAFVESLPVNSPELLDVLMEVAGLKKAKAADVPLEPTAPPK
jgi:hypothetical protein